VVAIGLALAGCRLSGAAGQASASPVCLQQGGTAALVWPLSSGSGHSQVRWRSPCSPWADLMLAALVRGAYTPGWLRPMTTRRRSSRPNWRSRFAQAVSWALTLLLAGLVIGLANFPLSMAL